MTTWFVRLGKAGSKEKYNTARYRDLAIKHSLVMIGFGIDKDITKLDSQSIWQYLYGKGDRGRSLTTRRALINKFINEVADGNAIICPFGNGTTNLKIGKVKGVCKAVGSFLTPKQLNDFRANHPHAKESNEMKLKPAREVTWEKNINLSDFSRYSDSDPADLQMTIYLLRKG